MDSKTVAYLIRQMKGDMSNIQFAKKAGVQPMSLTRWQNGVKIPLLDFEKLCMAAGYTMHEVLSDYEGKKGSIQDEFNIPDEYSSVMHELLMEALELEQENSTQKNSGQFTNLIIKHIREMKDTLRSMKVLPDHWLTIGEWIKTISADSKIEIVLPPSSFKRKEKSAAIFSLKNDGVYYYCSYLTSGDGHVLAHLKSLAHKMKENEIILEDVKAIIPSSDDWSKLRNQTFGPKGVKGQKVKNDEKNKTFTDFKKIVTAYYEN